MSNCMYNSNVQKSLSHVNVLQCMRSGNLIFIRILIGTEIRDKWPCRNFDSRFSILIERDSRLTKSSVM